MLWTDIDPGKDAVFLPGKIHGCTWQAYIIYINEAANDGNGSFEIEIVDAFRILKHYVDSLGDPETFFDDLPDLFQGEWKYSNNGSPDFDELVDKFNEADFLIDRDGDKRDEMMFLVNWAVKAIQTSFEKNTNDCRGVNAPATDKQGGYYDSKRAENS